jgi:NAD(P)-dependent dehydrogenase (short-subunit alcohol dehydrogenase family)
VKTAALDVVDPAAARAAVQVALDAFGRLDVLVNNAGFGYIAAFEQTRQTTSARRSTRTFMASST